jgi:sugar lactone lactonase YvrE
MNSADELFVADTYNHRVQKYDAEGNWLGGWGEYKVIGVMRSFFNLFTDSDAEGNFNYPVRVTVGTKDKVFVSDAYNNRVEVFSRDGKYLSQFGSIGFLGGSFRVSSGIAADKAGRIFVADFYNHRVQVFNEQGDSLEHWGKKGAEPGQFDGPTDIAVDARGRIYVVDWGNHRVQIFASR